MASVNFADKLSRKIKSKDSRVVLGLDPHVALIAELDDRLWKENNRELVAEVVRDFCIKVAEACSSSIVGVKPQVAFFERLGPPGWYALEQVVEACQKLDLLVISDCKRGDIGSTASAYAAYHLGARASSTDFPSLNADAVTANPFLGIDTLSIYDSYLSDGKGIFALVKTSNPGSGLLQNQILSGSNAMLYEHLGAELSEFGRKFIGECGYSAVGFVVGATHPNEARNLRRQFKSSIFLVPGYGAQGAGASDVAACFDENGLGAIVNASRSILFAHRNERYAGHKWLDASSNEAETMRRDINRAIENAAP